MATKRQEQVAAYFNQGAYDIGLELGGEPIEHPIWEHAVRIDTRCGPLEFHPATDPDDLERPSGRRGVRSHGFTVFCRFKDIDKMRAGGCADMRGLVNPYSGKYNFHYFVDGDTADAHVEQALDDFMEHLERVID